MWLYWRFNKREEAQEAISALNNVIPEGASQPLTVRLAEDHGKMKAYQFIAQFGGGGTGAGITNANLPAAAAGGYNNMVHRGRLIKTNYQKPHPYQKSQKFI